jgi:uncharacterized membrane protein
MEDDSKLKNVKKAIWISLGIAGVTLVGFILIMFFCYDIGIGGEYSPDITSSVGSFLGGVIGPLLTLASILFILYQSQSSSQEQSKQLRELKKQTSNESISKIIEFMDKLHFFFGVFQSQAIHSEKLRQDIDKIELEIKVTEKRGGDITSLQLANNEVRSRRGNHQSEVMKSLEEWQSRRGNFYSYIEQVRLLCDVHLEGEAHKAVTYYIHVMLTLYNAINFDITGDEYMALIKEFRCGAVKQNAYEKIIEQINPTVILTGNLFSDEYRNEMNGYS